VIHDPLCQWDGSTEFDDVFDCNECMLIRAARNDQTSRCVDLLETYAEENHQHRSVHGLCAPYQGDRCDITAALRTGTRKLKTLYEP